MRNELVAFVLTATDYLCCEDPNGWRGAGEEHFHPAIEEHHQEREARSPQPSFSTTLVILLQPLGIVHRFPGDADIVLTSYAVACPASGSRMFASRPCAC